MPQHSATTGRPGPAANGIGRRWRRGVGGRHIRNILGACRLRPSAEIPWTLIEPGTGAFSGQPHTCARTEIDVHGIGGRAGAVGLIGPAGFGRSGGQGGSGGGGGAGGVTGKLATLPGDPSIGPSGAPGGTGVSGGYGAAGVVGPSA